MITDPHSGFANDTMNKLRRLVGIREHEKSAASAKGKVAIVERSNQDLRLSMDDGFAKGVIGSRRDFRLYLKFHNAEADSGRARWEVVTSTADGRGQTKENADAGTSSRGCDTSNAM